MPRTAAAITLHTNLRAAVRMEVVAVITMVVAVITVVAAMAATDTKICFPFIHIIKIIIPAAPSDRGRGIPYVTSACTSNTRRESKFARKCSNQ